jgi:sugar lactone lactonase YvrE
LTAYSGELAYAQVADDVSHYSLFLVEESVVDIGPELPEHECRSVQADVAVALNGDVYIADTGHNRVVEVPRDRSKDTYGAQTAVGTNLLSPESVAVGLKGKVYIANVGNSSVVEVPAGCSAATSCTSQTTVASPETNGLANPTGLAVGPSGNLYIVDNGNNRVIVLPWNPSSNTYGTQTDVGAELVGPRGVALDATGNVYIADTGNNRVVKIAQSVRNPPTGNNGGLHMRR